MAARIPEDPEYGATIGNMFTVDEKKSPEQVDKKSVILIGNPNVGKSVIFGILTGRYVIVSNYPGTTVEVSRGETRIKNEAFAVIDTPGVNNLLPMSADEVVTRDILLAESNPVAVQVADAKNLARTFLITLQLAEMEIPMALVMNMADEARERRIFLDHKRLSEILGVEVFPTVAVSRTGTDKIPAAVKNARKSTYTFKYDPFIEEAAARVEKFLPDDLPVSKRSLALMILSEDSSLKKWLNGKISGEGYSEIEGIIRETRRHFPDPLEIVINNERMRIARELMAETAEIKETPRRGLMYETGKLCIHPIWGVPILIGVLYLMYYFVGVLAAGQAVDYLVNTVFGNAAEGTGIVLPFIAGLISKITASQFVQDFLVGEYGLISVGIAYAFGIVLPIVAAFFLFFSLLEDSGYLPRLAIMADKTCKTMGLNGKAILPMVLGLGCGTMATIAARILDSPKERMMVILLLALGIPCSAQLGVIMGMMAALKSYAFVIWILIVGLSLVIVGRVAGKILPGDTSDFILEIPPFRIPNFKNILIKTLARIEWYLKEAVPIFLLATLFLFIVDKTGILQFIQNVSSPLIQTLLGLPAKATNAFIMGFLRRDYGAVGLLEMFKAGHLTGNQVLVSMVTITLFLPCSAQFFIIIKEKGIKAALYVSAFVFAYAFLVGGLLNFLLNVTGVSL